MKISKNIYKWMDHATHFLIKTNNAEKGSVWPMLIATPSHKNRSEINILPLIYSHRERMNDVISSMRTIDIHHLRHLEGTCILLFFVDKSFGLVWSCQLTCHQCHLRSNIVDEIYRSINETDENFWLVKVVSWMFKWTPS